MEVRLQAILASVTDWLKFGEAKLAGLVALNGAAAIAALGFLVGDNPATSWPLWYLRGLFVLTVLSAGLALVGLLPRTTLPWIESSEKPNPSDNPLFFGHIEKYSPASYLELLTGTGSARREDDPILWAYAEQIVINSRIAATKFTLFRWAAWITLGALLSVPVALALLFFLSQYSARKH